MFRRARWEGSRKLYFYLTCGSEPGNAAKYCRRLCEDIGLEYMGTGVAVMPENYLVMFPTPDSAEAAAIIERAEPGIEAGAVRSPPAGPSPTRRSASWTGSAAVS